jgi:FkbM family methyltransferase
MIAVEPSPTNFEILIDNIKLNNVKNIIPINKALSNYVGEGIFLRKDYGLDFFPKATE